jgi:hypothetical protein
MTEEKHVKQNLFWLKNEGVKCSKDDQQQIKICQFLFTFFTFSSQAFNDQ